MVLSAVQTIVSRQQIMRTGGQQPKISISLSTPIRQVPALLPGPGQMVQIPVIEEQIFYLRRMYSNFVTWVDLVGVAAEGNTITKTASKGWGNSIATSLESLTGHRDQISMPDDQERQRYRLTIHIQLHQRIEHSHATTQERADCLSVHFVG